MGGIEGVDWRLVEYRGPDGALVPVPGGVEASARFDDGRVSGSSGCNRYSGGYVRDGDGLRIGPVAGTMMACPDLEMEVEAAFHALFVLVTGARVDGGGLALLADDGRTLLRFQASRVALAGTQWTATGVNNGRGGVESLVAGTEVDAVFGEDGRVSGSAGCNRFSGPWSATGAALSVGPLATARRLCAVPDGVMEQEAAFLAAMGRETTYRIDGKQLELRSSDGALQVAFRVA